MIFRWLLALVRWGIVLFIPNFTEKISLLIVFKSGAKIRITVTDYTWKNGPAGSKFFEYITAGRRRVVSLNLEEIVAILADDKIL